MSLASQSKKPGLKLSFKTSFSLKVNPNIGLKSDLAFRFWFKTLV